MRNLTKKINGELVIVISIVTLLFSIALFSANEKRVEPRQTTSFDFNKN